MGKCHSFLVSSRLRIQGHIGESQMEVEAVFWLWTINNSTKRVTTGEESAVGMRASFVFSNESLPRASTGGFL